MALKTVPVPVVPEVPVVPKLATKLRLKEHTVGKRRWGGWELEGGIQVIVKLYLQLVGIFQYVPLGVREI